MPKMKPSRLIAGLTTSTILVGSLALAPHALAEPTPPTPKPTPEPNAAPASPYSYAAIGDSATVGGSWFAPMGDLCGRNRTDYPNVLASNTGLQLNETACYNATTQNYQWIRPAGILNSPNPPQVKAIDKNTRMVTIQLGLRDIVGDGTNSLLTKCVSKWGKQYTSMVSGQPTELTGSPCRDAYGTATMKKFDGLQARLAAIYANAKARTTSDTLVVAVGYAPLFNGTKNCWEGQLIPARDRQFYNDIYRKLNRTIRQAARQAGVPSFVPSKDLGIRSSCGVPGLRFTSLTGLPEASYPMGPTVAGQAHIAVTLEQMWKDWTSTHSSLK